MPYHRFSPDPLIVRHYDRPQVPLLPARVQVLCSMLQDDVPLFI